MLTITFSLLLIGSNLHSPAAATISLQAPATPLVALLPPSIGGLRRFGRAKKIREEEEETEEDEEGEEGKKSRGFLRIRTLTHQLQPPFLRDLDNLEV